MAKDWVVDRAEYSKRNGGLLLHGRNLNMDEDDIDYRFHWHIGRRFLSNDRYDWSNVEFADAKAELVYQQCVAGE